MGEIQGRHPPVSFIPCYGSKTQNGFSWQVQNQTTTTYIFTNNHASTVNLTLSINCFSAHVMCYDSDTGCALPVHNLTPAI